jgi:glycosyltransferase involved in cell wall biosynthesis
MRIGIDATALPPNPVGAGNYIINLIRSLAALEEPEELVVFAQPHGRRLIDVPPRPGFAWVVLPEMNPALRLGWEQTVFPLLIRRNGIDLLHSLHYTMPLVRPCKTVVTYHDMTFFFYPGLHTRTKRWFFPLAIRASARRADALIAVSENTRRDSIRILGIPPEKICAIPLGVAAHFRPIADRACLEQTRRKYNLPDRFILYVGLVEPRKNLPSLIRAYQSLASRGVNQALVVVGRFGWMVSEVLDLVNELGFKDRVHFTGYIPDQDLPMVYNLADLFVYPSVYEGFGLPPIEALACGTPVVTTAVSTMPEHVGEAGVLVPPDDEETLAQAMYKVLVTPSLRQELAKKGPQQAAQFTWEQTSRKTMQVYRNLLHPINPA